MPQVTILEGGKPKSFAGVNKLQIALSGGGTSLWVPKDTRLLTALTANVNGTYPPPEGYFGFDTVIVDVAPSQVAGIDPETGQYIIVGTKKTESEDPKWPTPADPDNDPYDPDNPNGHDWDPWKDGNPWDKDKYDDDWGDDDDELTQEHIPSGIKIVVPPNKTSYTEGEPMDYSGISVQLVDENGELFTNDKYPNGLVPFNELVFPVSTASKEYDSGSDIPYDGSYHYVTAYTTYWGGTKNYISADPIPATSGDYYVCDPQRAGETYKGGFTYLLPPTVTIRFGANTWRLVQNLAQYCDRILVGLEAFGMFIVGVVSGDSTIVVRDTSAAYGKPPMTIYTYGRKTFSGSRTYINLTQVPPNRIGDVIFDDSSGLMACFTQKREEEIDWDVTQEDIDRITPLQRDFYDEYVSFAAVIQGGRSYDPSKDASGIPVQWVSPYDSITYEDKFSIKVSSASSPSGGGGGFSGGGGEGIGGEGGGGGF